MQDKTKNIIITVGFITILIVVFLINIISKDKTISITERRKLAQFPKITISEIISGDLMEDWEKYVEDQFVDRDFFRTIKSLWSVNIFKQKDSDIVFKGEPLTITERTQAGYVKNVKVGNKNYTGKQIREMLGLRSANFDIKYNGDSIIFVTKGYGHGAGLSQYGANHMAEGGSTYIDILKHYYTGVELAKIKIKN